MTYEEPPQFYGGGAVNHDGVDVPETISEESEGGPKGEKYDMKKA